MLKVKHVYEPLESKDGARFLVERLWPRGTWRPEGAEKEGDAINSQGRKG